MKEYGTMKKINELCLKKVYMSTKFQYRHRQVYTKSRTAIVNQIGVVDKTGIQQMGTEMEEDLTKRVNHMDLMGIAPNEDKFCRTIHKM